MHTVDDGVMLHKDTQEKKGGGGTIVQSFQKRQQVTLHPPQPPLEAKPTYVTITNTSLKRLCDKYNLPICKTGRFVDMQHYTSAEKGTKADTGFISNHSSFLQGICITSGKVQQDLTGPQKSRIYSDIPPVVQPALMKRRPPLPPFLTLILIPFPHPTHTTARQP